MADLGQTAYEAWQAADEYATPTPSWAGLARRQQARWAAAEKASLGIGTLPAGEHEQAAARYTDQIDSHPDLPAEIGAQIAVAHAVLGLCDLIRTAVANAD